MLITCLCYVQCKACAHLPSQMDPTVLDGDYSIKEIVWDFGDGTFLVRWNDYTHVHDTREPKEHIPAARVTYS